MQRRHKPRRKNRTDNLHRWEGGCAAVSLVLSGAVQRRYTPGSDRGGHTIPLRMARICCTRRVVRPLYDRSRRVCPPAQSRLSTQGARGSLSLSRRYWLALWCRSFLITSYYSLLLLKNNSMIMLMSGASTELIICLVGLALVAIGVAWCVCKRRRNRYAMRPISLLRENDV